LHPPSRFVADWLVIEWGAREQLTQRILPPPAGKEVQGLGRLGLGEFVNGLTQLFLSRHATER